MAVAGNAEDPLDWIAECTDQEGSRVPNSTENAEKLTLGGVAVYRCTACSQEFTDKDDMINHSKVHNDELHNDIGEGISLQICHTDDLATAMEAGGSESGAPVKLESNLLYLSSLSNDGTLYHCPECGRSFASSEGRNRHMKRHKDIKPTKCPKCKKSFYTREEFDQHIKTHDGGPTTKPFECSQCGKKCLTNLALKTHMRIHGDKTLECNVCKRSFFSGYHLGIHMMTHSDEKPQDCLFCDKRFCGEADLKKHMKSHPNARSFECSVCKKLFGQRSHLTAHMQTHKEKYECVKCKEKFTLKTKLNLHMKIHKPVKTNDTIVPKEKNNPKERNNSERSRQLVKSEVSSEKDSSSEMSKSSSLPSVEDSRVKPFKCFICDEHFISKDEVLSHLKSHNEKLQNDFVPVVPKEELIG